MPKKRRRKAAGKGVYYDFHGSFTSEEKAKNKARAVNGYYIKRTPRGSKVRRFVVLSQ